jgi:thiol-disulfide isomerase/thioredoxin
MHTPIMDRKSEQVATEGDIETETTEMQSEANANVESEQPSMYMNLNPDGEQASMYMNLNAEGEVDSAEGELDEPEWAGGEGEEQKKEEPRREAVTDRKTSRKQKREREKQERDRERQSERERKQRERREEKERKLKEKSKSPPPDAPRSPLFTMKEKSKSPPPNAPHSPSLTTKEKSKSPPPNSSNSPPLPTRERTASDSTLTQSTSSERDEDERASKVVVTQQPNQISACGQPVYAVFDTTNAGKGILSASCKGTKVSAVDTRVSADANGHYRVQFTPGTADMYMLSVRWCGKDVKGSPFLINLNLLPPAPDPETDESNVRAKLAEEKREMKGEGETKGEGEGQSEITKQEEKGGEEAEEQAKRVSQEMREKSPLIVVSDADPFDMAYEASRLLEEQRRRALQNGPTENADAAPSKPDRKVLASKEDWTPPSNHMYEDIPAAEEVEPPVSPLEAWLADAQFTDCFGEVVSREKLERAEVIGLYFSANWCPPCRRFLPKLVKFYHHLKQNQKSFEVLYISSDYSKQEMTKYMQEQQMPWPSLAYESTIADKLRVDYNVSAIPILTIVNKEGVKVYTCTLYIHHAMQYVSPVDTI